MRTESDLANSEETQEPHDDPNDADADCLSDAGLIDSERMVGEANGRLCES
jgi:hypothetical protein